MKKIGIRRTWGNIILLFVIGMGIGVVIGLRQPTGEVIPPTAQWGE